jgi:hypothetical protein
MWVDFNNLQRVESIYPNFSCPLLVPLLNANRTTKKRIQLLRLKENHGGHTNQLIPPGPLVLYSWGIITVAGIIRIQGDSETSPSIKNLAKFGKRENQVSQVRRMISIIRPEMAFACVETIRAMKTAIETIDRIDISIKLGKIDPDLTGNISLLELNMKECHEGRKKLILISEQTSNDIDQMLALEGESIIDKDVPLPIIILPTGTLQRNAAVHDLILRIPAQVPAPDLLHIVLIQGPDRDQIQGNEIMAVETVVCLNPHPIITDLKTMWRTMIANILGLDLN